MPSVFVVIVWPISLLSLMPLSLILKAYLISLGVNVQSAPKKKLEERRAPLIYVNGPALTHSLGNSLAQWASLAAKMRNADLSVPNSQYVLAGQLAKGIRETLEPN